MERKTPQCDPDAIARLMQTDGGAAMDRIAHCYMDYLLGVGRCACRDAAAAPDAVQDALVSALERLDQFRGDGSVKAWLSRMVVNACRCRQRGRKNDAAWNQPLTTEPEGTSQGPDAEAEQAELAEHLRAALGALRAPDQELFVLSQVAGISAPELAAMLEISPDTVRARLTRLRRRLRTQLGDVWRDWQ